MFSIMLCSLFDPTRSFHLTKEQEKYEKITLEKWKLVLLCFPHQTPLHCRWCSQTPVSALPHCTVNFIASICLCFVDFPCESMFTAGVALFYVLQTSKQILFWHSLIPSFSPPASPHFPHHASADLPPGLRAGQAEWWNVFTSSY